MSAARAWLSDEARACLWHNFRLLRPRLKGIPKAQRHGMYLIMRAGPLAPLFIALAALQLASPSPDAGGRG